MVRIVCFLLIYLFRAGGCVCVRARVCFECIWNHFDLEHTKEDGRLPRKATRFSLMPFSVALFFLFFLFLSFFLSFASLLRSSLQSQPPPPPRPKLDPCYNRQGGLVFAAQQTLFAALLSLSEWIYWFDTGCLLFGISKEMPPSF